MKVSLLKICSFLLVLVSLYACSSGKKALERGDYDEAVIKAVNRLRQKPDQKKARHTLKEAYPLAHDWHLDNISRKRQTSNTFKWEAIYNEYKALNRLYNEIERCPACKKLVTPTDYSHEADQAKITAGRIRYEEGILRLNKGRNGNRSEAKAAYNHFKKCNSYTPNYQDVKAKIEEAKFYATLKVLVEEIPLTMKAFKISHEFFENKVNEYLHSMSNNELVRFYSPEEARKTGLKQPDQVIYMEFDQFNVGAVSKNKREIDLVKENIVIGQHEVIEETVSYDTSGTKIIERTPVLKDVLGTVKARYKETTISIESKGLLDFKVVDAYTNKVLTQEKFPGTYVWRASWANFNGDERALSNEQMAATKRDIILPNFYPNAQDLFIEFTKPIFDQLSIKMRDFYRNY